MRNAGDRVSPNFGQWYYRARAILFEAPAGVDQINASLGLECCKQKVLDLQYDYLIEVGDAALPGFCFGSRRS